MLDKVSNISRSADFRDGLLKIGTRPIGSQTRALGLIIVPCIVARSSERDSLDESIISKSTIESFPGGIRGPGRIPWKYLASTLARKFS